MGKQKGLQVWSRLKHHSYTEAWTRSFFPGPGRESKQGPNSYSISDPQPPEVARHWPFRLLIRTAATGTQGMTGGRTTGESPTSLLDRGQEFCLAGSMLGNMLTKTWLGLEKLTSLMYLQS